MFYLQYDCHCFDWHLQVCSNEQNEERHVIFSVRLQFSQSFFETCISFHLLHILFLQPLHSAHDLHPLQCTISHSPTYNLRASCFFSYFQSHLKVKCVARPPIQNEPTSCMHTQNIANDLPVTIRTWTIIIIFEKGFGDSVYSYISLL